MIFDIITGVIGIGSDFLKGKQRLKEVKLEAEGKVIVARAEAEVARLSKAQDAEITWDQTTASQMSTSWKDEYLTLLLSAPMVLAFCGVWGKEAVADGFDAISNAPDWYKVAFLSSIAASFGIRALVDRFGFGKK